MTLQAILFDLWGTLILDPPERSRPRALWRAEQVYMTLRDHDFDVALPDVDRALMSAMRSLGALQDRGLDLTDGGRASLFCDELEQTIGRRPPALAHGALEQTIVAMPQEFQPLVAQDAVDVLKATKARGLATALVSNAGFTTSPFLRRMLDSYGLAPHLDVLVFSDELGVAKPDPRLFTAALDGLELAAAACAFVGDSPVNDIHGAQRAGLFAVQIGHRSVDGISPEAQISTLSELLPALQQHDLLAGAIERR